MKPSLFIFSSMISLSFINAAYSQNGSLQYSTLLLQHMKEAIDQYDQYHYKTQMRFKEMGGDTFEIRNFDISYRSNPKNPLFGYDWEINEAIRGGNAYTHVALPDATYAIFEGNKVIGKGRLPQKIDVGSYSEYIRDFFVLSEVYSYFLNVPPGEIKVSGSGDYYRLTRLMNENATREILVTRDTYLPVQSISTTRDEQFHFTQITEVDFYYNEHMKTLPDTAFSIDHYLSLGYTIHQNVESDSHEPGEIITFSAEKQESLLYYPFVTASGDTTSLMASDARYILLDFWYASCVPCLQAMPEVHALAATYAKEGFQVIGINCFDIGISDNVTKHLWEKNITMPTYFGSRELVQELGINSFPSYLLILPDRRVEYIDGSVEDVKHVLKGIFR